MKRVAASIAVLVALSGCDWLPPPPPPSAAAATGSGGSGGAGGSTSTSTSTSTSSASGTGGAGGTAQVCPVSEPASGAGYVTTSEGLDARIHRVKCVAL